MIDLSNRFKFVAIDGSIAGGKTTIGTELAEELGPETLLLVEPDEELGSDGLPRNPYLQDYYEESEELSKPGAKQPRASVAALMQMHLFITRHHIHNLAAAHVEAKRGFAVVDRIAPGDASFAHVQLQRGLMTEREFRTYAALYDGMIGMTKMPTVLIHIKVDPEVCIQRIKRRALRKTGRECEKVIGVDYLVQLQHEIQRMVDIMAERGTKIIPLDWNDDRDSPEARRPIVKGLADQIKSMKVVSKFLDLHRGLV